MIEKIITNFNIPGRLINFEGNNSGNINKTYVATFLMEDNSIRKYLIQKINTTVFPEPYKLMTNIERVTSYLKRQAQKGEDKNHKTLEIVKTKDRNLVYQLVNESGCKEYYRVYEFIENAISYDCSTDPRIVFNTGKAFGDFQRRLRDYPMDKLEETIKDFHNTPKRFKQLFKDIQTNPQDRVKDAKKEIDFILQRKDICSIITNGLEKGDIPLRVTHNDTKVNNVMMDRLTGNYLAVIDLDTVMPGSMLFDYGDGIRSTASSAPEDEKDLDKIFLRQDLFESYTDGYLSEMATFLTDVELSLMGDSIRVITLELAIRFLNDFINGDTYFKTNYPVHNLDRARAQLKLVEDIEQKLGYINGYIEKSKNKYRTRALKK